MARNGIELAGGGNGNGNGHAAMNGHAGDGTPGSRLCEYVAEAPLAPESYAPFIGREGVDELRRLADSVAGRTWANVNSTFTGGGVAEILRSALRLAHGLGIDARWYAIQSHDGFFSVTKKFHSMLQGMDLPISIEEIFDSYLGTIDSTSRGISGINADLVVVHDPQPAALIMSGVLFGNVLWRCHIDTSAPSPVIWRFLLPYINHCAGAIFTMPEFVGPGLHVPLYQITPAIDPLAEKNRQRTHAEAIEALAPLFRRDGIDPERPIFAAISRYDIHKNQAAIIDAFHQLRRQRRYPADPYLIFLGNTASDDPEGETMLAALRARAGDDDSVRFWVNEADNDRVVGALMRLARAFVHVSTREGFGLVVSEAMWQGVPVIGSRVGGIVRQVIDGETGWLLEPMDTSGIAASMAAALDDPEDAAARGRRGREHVRRNFLLPELMRRYLQLMRFHASLDSAPPPFRLNDVAYTEVVSRMRRHHPKLSGPLPLAGN